MLEHHQAKLIQANQSVPRILIAHAQFQVFIRSAKIRVSVSGVFDVGGEKDELLAEKLFLHVTILAGPSRGAIDGRAFVLIDAVLPFGISHLLVKFFRLAVLLQNRAALVIKDRKDHSVTTATQRRSFDLLAKARRDSHRLLHRQRRDLIVRPVDGIGRVLFELAGEDRRRAQAFFRHLMARGARDSVTRQRTILSVRLFGQSVNHAVRERLMPISFDLPLAHHAVTAITGVVKKFCTRRIESLFRFELGVKDWIASRQTHH